MNNSLLKAALTGLLSFATFSAVSAADVMVTPMPGANGGTTELKLEFVADADSNASALEFEVAMPGLSAAQVDTSSCVGVFAPNHASSCSFRDGILTFIVTSPDNTLLSTQEVGTVQLQIGLDKLGEISAQKLIVASDMGERVSASQSEAFVDREFLLERGEGQSSRALRELR